MNYSENNLPPVITETINLSTMAECSCKGKTYQNKVSLVPSKGYSRWEGQPVLKIEGTPGQWYLFTVLEDYDRLCNGICIDGGQNWNCDNFKALMDEALSILEKESAEVK